MGEINSSYEKMPKLDRHGPGPHRFAPVEKPKNAKAALKRLTGILAKFRKPLILAVFVTVAASAIGIIGPYFVGKAINTYDIDTGNVNTTVLAVVLISLAMCYCAGWITNTVSGVLMVKVTQRFVKDLRCEFFSKLQKIPLNFYDSRPHGDIMSRVTNDVDNISSTISQATTQLIASIFTICGTVIMMLVLNPILTAVAIITVPLFTIMTRVITKHSRQYFLGRQIKLGELNSIIEEDIAGLKMVKAFNRQEYSIEEFKSVNHQLCSFSVKAQIWSGLMMPFMNIINNLSYTLIACIGGILVVKGMTNVGIVVSFLSYSKQFGIPLNNIAGMFNSIQAALAGAERVFEILDEAEEPADRQDALELKEVYGSVKFQNVSFSYTPEKPVLKNVCFQVEPGEVVALVGETGAGKTTIVNLLTRFYELEKGQILIDGKDITDITKYSLHKCFSVVLQDTCLFSGTIFENIKYSKPAADEEQVYEAARLAHADDFIRLLPKGYDTVVSGRADSISLGQRQMIAIARAILCDSPILILDEATSSVDTKTEKDIQRALLELMKNRTSFLIAHRLSTIRDADKIMVIDHGQIVEMGVHSELMTNKGLYYKMVISQMGVYNAV
jgi:ATP-binding cassette subfamily B protein